MRMHNIHPTINHLGKFMPVDGDGSVRGTRSEQSRGEMAEIAHRRASVPHAWAAREHLSAADRIHLLTE